MNLFATLLGLMTTISLIASGVGFAQVPTVDPDCQDPDNPPSDPGRQQECLDQNRAAVEGTLQNPLFTFNESRDNLLPVLAEGVRINENYNHANPDADLPMEFRALQSVKAAAVGARSGFPRSISAETLRVGLSQLENVES